MRAMGAFARFSAGSHPKGQVHPLALETLQRMSLPVEGLRSKSWDEFSGPSAPKLDFVFTVCGNAAKETLPHWPGQPLTAHWGVDDPAAVEGTREEQSRAFLRALTRARRPHQALHHACPSSRSTRCPSRTRSVRSANPK